MAKVQQEFPSIQERINQIRTKVSETKDELEQTKNTETDKEKMISRLESKLARLEETINILQGTAKSTTTGLQEKNKKLMDTTTSLQGKIKKQFQELKKILVENHNYTDLKAAIEKLIRSEEQNIVESDTGGIKNTQPLETKIFQQLEELTIQPETEQELEAEIGITLYTIK
jgi:chromosome segregation ATPase